MHEIIFEVLCYSAEVVAIEKHQLNIYDFLSIWSSINYTSTDWYENSLFVVQRIADLINVFHKTHTQQSFKYRFIIINCNIIKKKSSVYPQMAFDSNG